MNKKGTKIIFTNKLNKYFPILILCDLSVLSNTDNQSFLLNISSSLVSVIPFTDFSASAGPYISMSQRFCPSLFSLHTFSVSNLTYSHGFDHHFAKLNLNPNLPPKFHNQKIKGLTYIYLQCSTNTSNSNCSKLNSQSFPTN